MENTESRYKLKSKFKKSLKVLKSIYSKVGRVVMTQSSRVLKFSLRSGKNVLKYILSVRVGIRPEFRGWVKGFKQRSIKDNAEFIRGYNETDSRLHRAPLQGDFKLKGLKKYFVKYKAGRLIGLLLPVIFAVLILKHVSPISAQLLGYEERLNSYLSENNITVGVEMDADKTDQVYYIFEGEKNFVTDSKNAKGGVDSKNEYITWMESVDGNWQIFLYHIPTKIKTQLTYAGNNVNPRVSNGKVVWEGIRVNENWQVYLYDGSTIGPISSGDASFKPDINGNFVVYSRKDINEQWRSTAYSINDRENVDIDFGERNKYVSLRDKDILIGFEGNQKKFSLNVEDLMILNLGTLSSQSSASIESIQKEIDMLTGTTQN